MLTKKLLTIVCVWGMISCSESKVQDTIISTPGDVNYQVTFSASWSAVTHPNAFPENPHFSGLIGATHNVNAVFWQAGELASLGIESMAENGSKSILAQEIQTSIKVGDSDKVISAGDLSQSPGSLSINLPVSVNYPFVTLVSMIAPSPDWFVGVSGVNLMENGVWVESKMVDLYVFDSGTDDGVSYTSVDADSNPKKPVSQIIIEPFLVNGNVKPVARFIIEKM